MKISTEKISIPALLITTIGSLIFIFTKAAINQDPLYHQFIDQRVFIGVPNFFDVFSNIFFIIFGFMGLQATLKTKNLSTRKSWIVFFVGVILVAPGSAYYHWAPDNNTLVWDRLPMTIGFMALFVALIAENINLKLEKLLIPMCLLGLASVVWWVYSSDLRFYYWVQLAPIVTIPVILLFFPSTYTGKAWFLVVLVCYLVAKVVEHRDPQIYEFTSGRMSGHTLKHILAAFGIYALAHMISTRKLKAIPNAP